MTVKPGRITMTDDRKMQFCRAKSGTRETNCASTVSIDTIGRQEDRDASNDSVGRILSTAEEESSVQRSAHADTL